MNSLAASRALLIAIVAAAALFSLWAIVQGELFDAPPGDFQVRQGDMLLSDGNYQAAIERFEAALTVSPEHPGALMGRAIALMQEGRTAEAEAGFTSLIAMIEHGGADAAGQTGLLASAYANRGILFDRESRYAAALADYRRALSIDAKAVSGPGIVHSILYGNSFPATVRGRADYLERQLALPEGERQLHLPEIDARQRMYKP